MAHGACKWILNNGVRAVVESTNVLIKEQLDGISTSFTDEQIESMIDLDLAYQNAKHLIQTSDEKTVLLAAQFSAEVAARAATRAADRVGDLE